MKIYDITIVQRNTYRVQVEAEDEKTATKIAYDSYTDDDHLVDSTIDWTMVNSCWEEEEDVE